MKKIGEAILKTFFYNNYAIGALAWLLICETTSYLGLYPLNTIELVLFSSLPIIYYNLAYWSCLGQSTYISNDRSRWLNQHKAYSKLSHLLIMAVFVGSLFYIVTRYTFSLWSLSWVDYLLILSALFISILYDKVGVIVQLRKIGWLKPITIASVWAIYLTYLPICFLKMKGLNISIDTDKLLYLGILNFMLCFLNATIFDIKDSKMDQSSGMNTYVVQVGKSRLVSQFLLPLILLSVGGLVIIPTIVTSDFRYLFYLLPFNLMLEAVKTLKREQRVLFYLVIVDGVILLKGIVGMIIWR